MTGPSTGCNSARTTAAARSAAAAMIHRLTPRGAQRRELLTRIHSNKRIAGRQIRTARSRANPHDWRVNCVHRYGNRCVCAFTERSKGGKDDCESRASLSLWLAVHSSSTLLQLCLRRAYDLLRVYPVTSQLAAYRRLPFVTGLGLSSKNVERQMAEFRKILTVALGRNVPRVVWRGDGMRRGRAQMDERSFR